MGSADRAGAIARRFGARAATYDEHAHLQRLCAGRLAGLIAERGLPRSGVVAEIGCGTGLLSAQLAPLAAAYLATDLAPEMLARCKERLGAQPHISYAVLDGEHARFADAPAAIVSNLTAQWFRDPAAGLARLAEQTPFFAFSVPLSGSFPEWERAFAELGRDSGLHPLPQEQELRRALGALPCRAARFSVEAHVIRYPNARAFADGFRGIGADTPRPGYRPAPIRRVLERFRDGIDATARVLYALITEENA
jgi:malonyl-CoA O-methyltransferase